MKAIVVDVEPVVAPSGAVDGIDATFDDLYRREQPDLVRLAVLLVGSPEAAADLVQDCFVRLHPRWAKVDDPRAVVHAIVFTAPDRASIHFSLVSDDPSIPAPGERIGEGVLLDGGWKVSIDTSCELIALAGIECDRSL